MPPPPAPPAPRSLFLIRKGEPGLRCFRQTKCFEKHRLINFKPGAKEIRGFLSTSDEQCIFCFLTRYCGYQAQPWGRERFPTIGEPVSFSKPLI